MMRPVSLAGVAILAAPLIASTFAQVSAQTVEENEAPILRGEQVQGLPAPAPDTVDDDAPLGVDLAQLRIVTEANAVSLAASSDPVDLTRAGSFLDDPQLSERLKPYLGAPMTKRLISEIQAEISAHLRAQNRPLAAITTPPQEISGGTLTFLVTLFKLADVRTEGNEWTPDEHLVDAIRSPAGEPVDSAQLIEDVNWLNLNPYRNLGVVFEPGTQPGETNLILRSAEEEPYSFFAGYSNSGASKDDQHRVFAGFTVGNFPFTDAQLSYQYTTSPDTIAQGRFLSAGNKEGFLTHALSLFAPVQWDNGYRGKISVSASYVSSFLELSAPFTQDNKALLLSGEYAVPLSFLDGVRTDVYGRAEFKRQENEVFFAGTSVNATDIEVVQGAIGVRGDFATEFAMVGEGRANFDFSALISPGGITGANDDQAFAAAAGNPSANATYALVRGSLSHLAPLTEDVSHRISASFQFADTSLPGIEKFAFGGATSVRGYLTNEASGDKGFWIRNEIIGPTVSLFAGEDGINDAVQPFAFFDYGSSDDEFAGTSEELASVGVGANISVNNMLSGSLIYGLALADGAVTDAGDHRVFLRLTSRF